MCERCSVLPIAFPGTKPHLNARLPWIGRIGPVLGVAVALSACGESPVTESPVTEPEIPEDSVVSILMLPAERPLSFVGMSVRISAVRVDANGTRSGGATVNPHLYTWASDAPGVVAVDSLGWITAVSEGTAAISATSAGVTGTATVAVRNVIRPAWTYPLRGPPGGLTIGEDTL